MIKRIKWLGLLIIFVLIILGCSSDSDYNLFSNDKTEMISFVSKLHNGDAKFLDCNILTSINGKMALYNLEGKLCDTYENVKASWISVCPGERVIAYSNGDKNIGIAKLDGQYKLIANNIVLKCENLHIDPAIIKVNNCYYMTVTEVEGTVNNADETKENGKYTIHFYKSEDLLKWTFVSDVSSCYNNLEDVDILFEDNSFYICYEKEEVDKGVSSICIVKSLDSEGKNWFAPKELLSADSDHEPATIEKLKDGSFKLYYSCDKDYIGASYSGAKMYFAVFDRNFDLIYKDIEVSTDTGKGILLYDTKKVNGKELFLFAKDYLSDCDMVIEGRKTEED